MLHVHFFSRIIYNEYIGPLFFIARFSTIFASDSPPPRDYVGVNNDCFVEVWLTRYNMGWELLQLVL